ncbi:hypothetical protein AX768_09110 [Burkholderia sp. PAMC 28687]|uniref:hypothetical protein n=1 Tax=Burkholderia sp. PAMC 28687 TaxID=1795874 RepID=UPI000781CF34|nr:hypothetical protein [Burkholderia sp. PAMC 28687]AMM14228.1 hypothetical protein AX768_09110 [Burkholderia sp. PAMC 28687]
MRSRNKYKPHLGAKEQERAKRLWESEFLNEPVAAIDLSIGHKRSSPTLCQSSKRFYAAEERAMFNV